METMQTVVLPISAHFLYASICYRINARLDGKCSGLYILGLYHMPRPQFNCNTFSLTELRYVTVHKAHNYEHLFCFGVVIS